MRKKKQIFHAEQFRIESKFYRYSTLNKVYHNFLLLKCGLCRVTSLQRGQCGKGEKKSKLALERHDKHYFSQMAKVNIQLLTMLLLP